MRLYRSASIKPDTSKWFVVVSLLWVWGLGLAAVAAEQKSLDPVTQILLGDHSANRKSFSVLKKPMPYNYDELPGVDDLPLKLTINKISSGPDSPNNFEILVSVPDFDLEEIKELKGEVQYPEGKKELFKLENLGNGQWRGTCQPDLNGRIFVYSNVFTADGDIPRDYIYRTSTKVPYDPDLSTSLSGPPIIESGKPGNWNVNIVGGTPPYTTEINWGDGEQSSLAKVDWLTAVFSHTYQKGGSIYVWGGTRDNENAYSSFGKMVEVIDPLTIEVSGPSTLYLDEKGTWVAKVAGGYRPKRVWFFIDGVEQIGCDVPHNQGSCTQSVSFSSPGTHRIGALVFDKVTNSVSAEMNVSVTEKLFSVSLAGPGALKLKEAGAFTATAIGGKPPYSFYFYWGDGSWEGPLASSGNSQTATHAYQKVGNFTPGARVEDSTGESVTSHPIAVSVTCPDGYALCAGECWPDDYQCCGNGACGGNFPVCCGNGCCDANSYCANPGAGLCCRNGTTPVPGAGPGGYICCAPGLKACDDGVSCCYP